MIFDSEKKGLTCIYKPWQVEALHIVMAAHKPIGTFAVYDALLTRGSHTEKSKKLSRASVINFLKAALDDGVLDAVSESGKGGYHALYTGNMNSADEATLKRVLKMRLIAAVEEELQ